MHAPQFTARQDEIIKTVLFYCMMPWLAEAAMAITFDNALVIVARGLVLVHGQLDGAWAQLAVRGPGFWVA